MISNILHYVNIADNRQRTQGLHWYDTAHNLALQIAQDYHCNVLTAAGLIAVFSVNNSWGNNKRAVLKACTLHASGLPWQDWHIGLHHCERTASAILTQNSIEPLKGIKVNSFARCIAGDYREVVIDRWAVRVCLADGMLTPPSPLPKKAYELYQNEYTQAAEILGLTPCATQAIAWIVIRESTLGTKLPAYEY